jgi:hypothetical protein
MRAAIAVLIARNIGQLNMKRKPDERQHGLDRPPKLLPAGSVNRVLLIGAKNLTIFQSVGLMFIGVVAGGVGGLFLVGEFGFGAAANGHTDAVYLLLFAGVMILWGVVMLVNGARGVAGRIRRGR